jgi:hypothetical protein
MWRHVNHFQADNIAPSKFAVDGQVKQREIPNAVRQLKARSHRPDMFWAERWSCPDDLAFVPRFTSLVMSLAVNNLVHICFSFYYWEKPVRPNSIVANGVRIMCKTDRHRADHVDSMSPSDPFQT